MNCLKIDKITQLYLKHKIFGFRQFRNNPLSNNILNFLIVEYNTKSPTKQSFITQLDAVFRSCRIDENADHKTCIASIDSEFECNEVELREKVSEILQNCTRNNSFLQLIKLNEILRVNFES